MNECDLNLLLGASRDTRSKSGRYQITLSHQNDSDDLTYQPR